MGNLNEAWARTRILPSFSPFIFLFSFLFSHRFSRRFFFFSCPFRKIYPTSDRLQKLRDMTHGRP